MKNISTGFIIIIALLFFGIGTGFADTPTDLYNEETCYYGWGDDVVPGYHIYDNRVYYYHCPLEGVDSKSFKPLTADGKKLKDYAADKNYIYYKTRRLDGLSPVDFKIKQMTANDEVILYDDDTVYLDAMEVSDSGMDVETFRMENGAYRDDRYLYARGQTPDSLDGWVHDFAFGRVEGGDPDNYAAGYKITPDAVYWYGKKIEEADAGSFEVKFDHETARDKNNLYEKGKVVYGVDVKSFQIYEKEVNGIVQVHNLHKGTISSIKKEIPKSEGILNASIKSALLDYKSKYSGYSPRPAIDPDNPPFFPALNRLWDKITDYKYLNPPLYYAIVILPFALILAGAGYAVYRRQKAKK